MSLCPPNFENFHPPRFCPWVPKVIVMHNRPKTWLPDPIVHSKFEKYLWYIGRTISPSLSPGISDARPGILTFSETTESRLQRKQKRQPHEMSLCGYLLRRANAAASVFFFSSLPISSHVHRMLVTQLFCHCSLAEGGGQTHECFFSLGAEAR